MLIGLESDMMRSHEWPSAGSTFTAHAPVQPRAHLSFRLFLHCPGWSQSPVGIKAVSLGGELPEVWSPTSQAEPTNGPASGEDLGRIHQGAPQSGHRPGDCCASVPPAGSVPRQCSWRGREDEVSFRGGLFIILTKPLQVQRQVPEPTAVPEALGLSVAAA